MTAFAEEEKKRLCARAAEIPEIIRNCIVRPPELNFPFLPAGAGYRGIWIEHNQDNLFITGIEPEAAWGSMKTFLYFQREDGLFPASVNSELTRINFGQLQTVWPFARCALEVAKKLQRPETDYLRIYEAAARYDAWLEKYRDHSGSGLIEMFCEFDTGHDNSPRVTDGGLQRQCPEKDAKNMPGLPCMPIIAADLSATRYGSLTALAELAGMLGKEAEAAKWQGEAARVQENMMKLLFCEEDLYFYDRSPAGFRKYRTEHITRLFLNKVVPQELFDRIYERFFTDEKEFFPAFPIPAVSVSDPHFCKELPFNCWGSNTQMLTLLRMLLFMDDYGKSAELDEILARLLRSYLLYPQNGYSQEINPFTGEPIGESKNYMPAMLLFRESCRRLFGRSSRTSLPMNRKGK